MKLEYKFSRANKNTFQMPPVAKLIKEESRGCDVIIEPFPYRATKDVFDYLAEIPDESADLALVDPPYTKRQISEHYQESGVKVSGWHTSEGWAAKVRYQVGRKIKPGGKAITFGYNSTGIGHNNGFEKYRLLVCYSGTGHYDLLCMCSRKVQSTLDVTE